MEVIKETTVKAITTNKQTIEGGDCVAFTVANKSYIAEFVGYTSKGAVNFKNLVDGKEFNFMPKSIETIYKAEVKIYDL